MWIFLNDAMVSIVADKQPVRGALPVLAVRARRRADLESFLGRALGRRTNKHQRKPKLRWQIIETPAADYRFRAFVSPADVAAMLSAAVATLDYLNFKSSVRDPERHRIYNRVWEAGLALDERPGFDPYPALGRGPDNPLGLPDLWDDRLPAPPYSKKALGMKAPRKPKAKRLTRGR